MEAKENFTKPKKGISKENWEKILAELQPGVNRLPTIFKDSTFQNFDVDDYNRKASLKCIEYASNPNGFLTITGKTGSGKTHLAAAIAKTIPPIELNELSLERMEKEIKLGLQEFSKGKNEEHKRLHKMLLKYYHSNTWHYRRSIVYFIQTIRFLVELNDLSVKNDGSTQTKLDYLKNVLRYDLIILDDFGSEKLSEAAKQNLFFLIDECYVNNKPMVITSNNLIEEINEREPRIASRLSSGEVILLNSEDYRLKPKKLYKIFY